MSLGITMNMFHFCKWRIFLFTFLVFEVEGQIRYTIPEELKEGSVIGNIAKDLGLGLTEIIDRRLRIASDAGERYFHVDMGRGELAVIEKIDREALCSQKIPCVLPLEALVENPLQLHRIEIEIQDINDNSPTFPSPEHVLRIPENVKEGAKFPLGKAEDPDVGVNSLASYTLSKNDHFVLNVINQDGAKIPELILQKSLDRESHPIHKLILTAVDGGKPIRKGTSEISIIVIDTNDNSPQFEKTFYEGNIAENTAPGTEILRVKAIDFDEGTNGEVEYFFGEQSAETTLQLFDINAATGVISVKAELDYEKASLLKFGVVAKDRGTPQLEGHCSVKVKISDVNDNAPEITITSLTNPIPENSPVGTVVAFISAKDGDSGDNGKVEVNVASNSPFKLNHSVSNHYMLVTNAPIDREIKSKYDIQLRAVDMGSPALSSKKTISITISDTNDNPPAFTQKSYTVYVKENCPPGSMLATVSGQDPDIGKNSEIVYSILDSGARNIPVSSYIYINSENGSVYSMHSFDYETMKVFRFGVQAKDQGSPSLSSNATVHVFILDENDNVPSVIYPSALMGSVPHQRMPRAAKAGHLVNKVTAVDADSGHNAWISYRLAEATDASLFAVNLYTGEVRTKRSVSEQDDSSQRLLIEIKDNGEPAQSTTVTVDIIIDDGLQEPISDYRQKANEREKKNSKITFYLILSLASVSVLSLLTFFIMLIKCARGSRGGANCCVRRDSDGYKNPNRNLQIQLNTDGPIKYVEVLGGDVMSQSQSFGSYLTPMSEFSDLTLVKPSSTLDFKDTLRGLDASLPDSAWTFECQQVSCLIIINHV